MKDKVRLKSYTKGIKIVIDEDAQMDEILSEMSGCVEQGDLNALSETIKEFQVLGFKQKHSVDCRKRSEEHFDKDKCFEKYIELYNGLLK